SMLRSARVTSTWRPNSSLPRWTGSQIDSGATGMVSAVIAAHLPIAPWRSAGYGDQGDEGFAAVGAYRAAAQWAGLVGDRRQLGEQFELGLALVAQPVLGRGGDERGAAALAGPGGADQLHVLVPFREIKWLGGRPRDMRSRGQPCGSCRCDDFADQRQCP